jgi:hypothetical protein
MVGVKGFASPKPAEGNLRPSGPEPNAIAY